MAWLIFEENGWRRNGVAKPSRIYHAVMAAQCGWLG